MKHLIWSNNDANDSFEVEGNSFQEVLLNALSELGWSVSETPIEEEIEDEFPEEKTFPIIVINKSNMSTLMHFKDADKAALFLINDNGFNAKNWIIIKNENKVVDISDLEGIFGVYTQHQKIRKAIEDS